jgi:hypothetical protein
MKRSNENKENHNISVQKAGLSINPARIETQLAAAIPGNMKKSADCEFANRTWSVM